MTRESTVVRSDLYGVLILSLGFGLVGIDRFLIATLYPTIAKDLGLGYTDIGVITGVLAIAWGAASLVMGNVADRIGQRRVLTGSLVVFSLLIGASGLAHGLLGLVLVRLAMGFADGTFTPASITATVAMSRPDQRGRNVGFQQTMLVLFGLGISPLIVGALLRHGLDWRYIFILFLPPGLLLAWLTWRVVPAREPVHTGAQSSIADWLTVLRYRNVRLLMLGMLCWLSCLITTSAFLPSYLVDHLKLSTSEMGTVMSAIGFGAMAGTLVLSALSDSVGRRPIMVGSSIGALASLGALGFIGPDVGLLFACVFSVHFFNNALITLTVGPIAVETVPARLMTTASGLVIATGEILGGGLVPIVCGYLAQHFGIHHVLHLPVIMMAIGVVLCLGLHETLTARKQSAGPQQEYWS